MEAMCAAPPQREAPMETTCVFAHALRTGYPLKTKSLLGSGTFGNVFSASHPVLEGASSAFHDLVVKRTLVGDFSTLHARGAVVGSDSLGEDTWARVGGSREVALSRALGPLFDCGAALEAEAALRGGAPAAAPPPLPLFPAFLGACAATEEVEVKNGKGVVAVTRVVRLLALERAGRDLYSEVRARPDLFCKEPLRRCVAHQLLTLLAGLHERGVLHRDLKMQNTLLQWVPWGDSLAPGAVALPPPVLAALRELPGYPLLRLCDLGASRAAPLPPEAYCAPPPPGGREDAWEVGAAQPCPQLRAAAASSHVCARWYRAPELLCGSAFYGPPSDVWSMALAIAELYTLSAALTGDGAARRTSVKRGDAYGDSLPLEEVEIARPPPPPGAAPRAPRKECRLSAVTAAAAWAKEGWRPPAAFPFALLAGAPPPSREKDFVRATLFHGSCDATQLLSIINVLGTPPAAAVEDMRLPRACCDALLAASGAVLAAASADAGISLTALPALDVPALLTERFALPRDMAELLSGMLLWAPSARATAAEALRHPALSGSGVGVPA
jgi:serine/threonine protein kinase